MPGNNVKGRMIILDREKLSLEFIDDCPLILGIFIPCNRSLKVSRICQPVGSNRAKIRNHEVAFEDLSDVSAGLALEHVDRELDSALYNANLERLDSDAAKLGLDQERAMLRHNEEVAIAVVEGFPPC